MDETAPCDLCWYQRMAMYPLVLILGIGMYRKDPHVSTYAFPFACMRRWSLPR